MNPAERETCRNCSAALFGNRFVVDVVLAIKRLAPTAETFVTTRMIASETMLSDSLVRPVLLRLENAGLLARLPRAGGPRSMLHYQIQRGPLWDAVITTCAATGTDAVQAAG